ncbi:DUF917 domain-containing protein [Actinophytocola oryzae]|uniref:DUF917 domain-containing protein n=1 Tax=Actinophytocola oryzae TaxID=502181 RepID=A0A4R7VI63_9PSEU|nr:DUF917 domain-containing protein [Actinophytocola oryzae]TDV48867.1 hypothetical protein CLV71_108227 [Actinophytocola oryzae]
MEFDQANLPAFARGCDVLGAGGGGPAGHVLPLARYAVAQHGPVRVVRPDELPADELVMPCAYLGAPDVLVERIGTGRESVGLRRQVEAHFGRPVAALMCTEVGGLNGPSSVMFAAHAGLPLLDADAMGRAFPGVEQVAMQAAGVTASPSILADEHERVVTVQAESGEWLERLARSVSSAWGDRSVTSEYVMTVEQAAKSVVLGSISRAANIGRVLEECAGAPTTAAVGRLAEELGGIRLAECRVTRVHRVKNAATATLATNSRRTVLLEGVNRDEGRWLRLEAGHEYHAVLEDGELRATVPDIITVFDVHSGEPVPVRELRYGLRVVVLALPCPPLWLTPDALRLVGPRAFGLAIDYVPLAVAHA